jgi:hypothetical protein
MTEGGTGTDPGQGHEQPTEATGEQQLDTVRPGAALTPLERWMGERAAVEIKVLDDSRRMIQLSPQLGRLANILGPMTSVIQMDANWSPVPKMVQLEPFKDTYKQGARVRNPDTGQWEDQHAIKGQSLMKLAELAGIEHQWTRVQRWANNRGVDVKVRARRRGPDGLWVIAEKTRSVDFDDHAERLMMESIDKREKDQARHGKGRYPDLTERQLRKLVLDDKEFLIPKLETKAYLRCIRALLGITALPVSSYRRPFFCIGWAMTPDYSMPGVQEMVRLQYADSTADLYGQEAAEGEPVAALSAPEPEQVEGHLHAGAIEGSFEVEDDGIQDEDEVPAEQPAPAPPPRTPPTAPAARRAPPARRAAPAAPAAPEAAPSPPPGTEPAAAAPPAAESWIDEGGEQQVLDADVVEEPPAKPEKTFRLRGDLPQFGGWTVEQLVMNAEGRRMLVHMCVHARYEERRQEILDWFSWQMGRPITMDTIHEVMEADQAAAGGGEGQ